MALSAAPEAVHSLAAEVVTALCLGRKGYETRAADQAPQAPPPETPPMTAMAGVTAEGQKQ